jgi:hypothetical protein
MLAKMTRSAPRPLFGLPAVTGLSEPYFYLAGRPRSREYIAHFGGHPGNPGSNCGSENFL